MELYLIRHGIAEDAAAFAGPDLERPLTEEGISKAHRTFQGLRVLVGNLDRIISSAARRSRMTAEILAGYYGKEAQTMAALNPGAEPLEYQRTLRNLHDSAIAIVGHEPDLSRAIQSFTGGEIRIEIKKASVAMLEYDEKRSVLTGLFPPRMLRQVARGKKI
ncbi:MAG: phosphohistidine phosphatase SixA [Spirochaetales bacterium]|nr:phosphohistidine phosphatase SixA [Spirochaetales bacterium]